jgi:hypothetical protein
VLSTTIETVKIVHPHSQVNCKTMSQFFIALFAVCVLLGFLSAQEPATPDVAKPAAVAKQLVSASDLIPQTTQGYLRIVNLPLFVERWNRTQLGLLGSDSRLKEFWEEQRVEIEKRFSNAGWQLNFRAEDIYDIASGQAAIAWIAKPQDAQKPYTVALVLDVAGNVVGTQSLLERIDKELKDRKATSQDLEYQGVKITQYTLPRGAGEIVVRESLYALVGDQLFAADELATMQGMIDASQGKLDASLSKLPLYITSTARLSENQHALNESDVEYFVQPTGLAKILRAIGGKPIASQTDALKVLENQGFAKVTAARGRVHFGSNEFDVFHDSFVLTDPPLPRPVQVLDFPNVAGEKIPTWVGSEASTFLSMAWNAKEAFWKVDTIVDEMAGQKGVFESVIDGIKNDPVGPQIDIKTQVLPFLTPEIYSVGDTVDPITTESRRSLIAIRVNDPDGRLASVLDRAMTNEPDAKPEDFKNIRIWKVSRSENDDDAAFESDDFGFGNKTVKPPSQVQDEKPLLSNWAITVYHHSPQNPADGFLMFASHAEMIKEAIDRNLLKKNSEFASENDVKRVIDTIEKLNKGNNPCVWQVSRTDKAFKMQYELFRQDKLPQSKSMIATILDRLLRPKDEVKQTDQKVKGDKLPTFETIQEFLMPGGARAHSVVDGWSFSGFILAKPQG